MRDMFGTRSPMNIMTVEEQAKQMAYIEAYKAKKAIQPRCKPPIKWVGGKTQLLDKLFSLFPKNINNYFELFIGGGSVLIRLLETIKITGKIHAYDINKVLIGMYKNIQNNIEELIKYLSKYQTTYLDIKELNGRESESKESY